MVKFKFSLSLILFILLLPSASSEVTITANNEENLIFVNSGENVTFNSLGIENSTAILWDFGRDINGPETRYSESQNITHQVHASGRYNVTFTVSYTDSQNIVKELILIVNFEEDYQNNVVHNEALFFAIAGSELIMSAILGYWTQQIRKEKVYLWRLLTAIKEVTNRVTNNEIEGSPESSTSSNGFSSKISVPSPPTLTVGP